MQNVGRTLATQAPTTTSLLRQAEALQAQAAELAAIISHADNDPGNSLTSRKSVAALVKAVICARSRRYEFLPRSLFADPAWDILLELYLAGLTQQRMSVSNVCTSANVPATTALRWLATLESRNLVARRADPLDARRFFITLTQSGEQAMENFFGSIKNAVLAA